MYLKKSFYKHEIVSATGLILRIAFWSLQLLYLLFVLKYGFAKLCYKRGDGNPIAEKGSSFPSDLSYI